MPTQYRTALAVLGWALATACGNDDGTPFDPGISGNPPPATNAEVLQLVDLVNDHRNGESPFDRLDAAGVDWSGMPGQNIAYGTGSGSQVFDMWINSAGHRANIENCSFTHHGVGLVDGRWTHLFLQNPTT